VDGAVQRPVPAAAVAVPDGLAAAGLERAGAAQGGERGLAATPARVGEAHDGLRGADWPHAVAAGQAGSDVIGDGQQPGAVVLQLAPGLGERERQAAGPGLPDGLLAAGMTRDLAVGKRGQGPAGQGGAGGAAVGIVPGQQQGTQPPGLRGAGPDELLPGN
jgi:hypothetical protein